MRKSKKTIVISKIIATVMTCSFVMTGTMGSYRMGAEVLSDDTNFILTSKAGILSEDAIESEVTISSEDAVKIDSLHAPIIDASTGAVTFSYVYFGSYPQSEVTGEALTEAIKAADYIDGDAVVGVQKYRRLEQNGEYHYFRFEPVKWRVIEKSGNMAELRTEAIVDCKAFNDGSVKTSYVCQYWITKSIRYWLNAYEPHQNGFLQSAFTKGEQNAIVAKKIEEVDTNYVKYEVEDKLYMGGYSSKWDKNALITKDTDYATAVYGKGYPCNNWTIGIANQFGFCSYVDSQGNVHKDGLYGVPDSSDKDDTKKYYMNYSDTICGICPTLTLDLTNTDVWRTEESEPSITYQKGDVTQDGKVTLEDAQLTLKAALKIIALTEEEKVYADMNEDGKIELEDARMVLKKALKI